VDEGDLVTVVVFGSANVDLVVTVDRHPRPGETVAARGPARRQAGGKGLNQAIASARSAAHLTVFVGATGIDDDGRLIAETLQRAGVSAQLRLVPGAATGTALVVIDGDAENTIIVSEGANQSLSDVTASERETLGAADVALFQGEIPPEGFESGATTARAGGAIVVLNPAPVWTLTPAQAALVDVLVVNDSESRLVAEGLGIRPGSAGADELCRSLAARFPSVVITLGADGVVWVSAGSPPQRIAAPRVTAVDTTGAGDTFCGTLAGSLAEGLPFGSAVERGVRASAAAVTRVGAADAVPALSEIPHLLPPTAGGPAGSRTTQKGT
jgi:ribokinase